jgi:hypothetical protein
MIVTHPVTAANKQAFSVQTSTSTTLTEANARIGCAIDVATPGVVTIPINTFPVGQVIPLLQLGAGQVTVSPAASVTLNSRGAAYKLAGQHATAVLIQTAVNAWNLSGDITA